MSQVRPHYEACMLIKIVLISSRFRDCNTVEARLVVQVCNTNPEAGWGGGNKRLKQPLLQSKLQENLSYPRPCLKQ